MFRWIWNLLMEWKQERQLRKEFENEYAELRLKYDTKNMTDEQIDKLNKNNTTVW